MMRNTLAVTFFFLLSYAFSTTITILGGVKGGTYNAMATDLQNILESYGINTVVVSSQGAWQNILDTVKGKADISFTQLDAYFLASYIFEKKLGKKLSDTIKVLLILYPEEIHILTNKNSVKNIYDLDNAFISCGPKNSGSCVTAELLSYNYKIKFNIVNLPFEKAIEALRMGKLDAVIITIGKPAPLLEALPNDIRLVELPSNPELRKLLQRTTIDPGDYKWNNKTIATYAVPSILIARFTESKEHNRLIGRIMLSILSRESYLKKAGHPKWKEVRFNEFFTDISHPVAKEIIQLCNRIKAYGFTCDGMKPLH